MFLGAESAGNFLKTSTSMDVSFSFRFAVLHRHLRPAHAGSFQYNVPEGGKALHLGGEWTFIGHSLLAGLRC